MVEASRGAAAGVAETTVVEKQPHRLESKLTFWFDNQSKSKNGATWGSSLRRAFTFETIEQFWSYLMALIGEQFEEVDEICGVVVNLRQRQDKIALWTKSVANEAVQMSIGRKWKEVLDVTDKIAYSFHDDSKRERSVKSRYSV